MMGALEILRQRSARKTAEARVDCGSLGLLTAEALPLRECAALSRGPDGDRAVLYAACRELQAAGEILRAEGMLFTPDQVMQYVSDEEAKKGADIVRTLSGSELLFPADTDIEQEPMDLEVLPQAGAFAEQPEQNTFSPAATEGRTDSEAVRGDPAAKQEPEKTSTRTSVRPLIEHTLQEEVSSAPEKADDGDTPLEAVRLLPVQVLGEDVAAAVRLPSVQNEAEGVVRPEAVQGPAEGIIRPEPVQVTGMETIPGPAEETGGQVSHEFFSEGPETSRDGRMQPEKVQIVVSERENRTQNVASAENAPLYGEVAPGGRTEGVSRESSAGQHKSESDFREKKEAAVHENKSVLHEITSERVHDPMSIWHEIKSEFKHETGPSLHESTSEFLKKGPSVLHEIQTEQHEITSELAEWMALELLRGLRRAAQVR